MISYAPLWKTLKQKGISQYKLVNDYDISNSLLQRMRDNQSITLSTVQNLCDILDCDIQDIVHVSSDKKKEE